MVARAEVGDARNAVDEEARCLRGGSRLFFAKATRVCWRWKLAKRYILLVNTMLLVNTALLVNTIDVRRDES